MPLLLNGKPNPQAVMLGRQHVRKIMLGAKVVWQKPGIPIHGLTLESLEHKGVKLVAENYDGTLRFPMFFPDRFREDGVYLNRVTFVGGAVASLMTIDGLLVADVVENDMHFPKFFFNEEPEEGKFDYRRNLTFIANEYTEDDEEYVNEY